MTVAICILQGFRQAIENKVFDFAGHLHIKRFGDNAQELSVISAADSIAKVLQASPHVRLALPISYKPCLIKTQEEIQGVLLKGIPNHLSTDTTNEGRSRLQNHWQKSLVSGVTPDQWNQRHPSDTAADSPIPPTPIVVSTSLAKLLNLQPGQELVLYFMQEPPRFRKAVVSGVYQTGLEDQDKNLVWVDAQIINQLNDWPKGAAGVIEVHFNHADSLAQYAAQVEQMLPYDLGGELITERFGHIFEWLGMIGNNVEILTWLIIIVACFNMFSTLLIMILERIPMIGLLKSMGASAPSLASIFLYAGTRIILTGVLLGNALGLGLCWLQYRFNIITLDAGSYYMDFVPISWDWQGILEINLITVGVSVATLAVCTLFTLRIRPSEAIRFQ